MNAEIIAIGTEILLGHIVNTNAAYLSSRLAELGIDVYRHTTVGDNPARLSAAIKEALERTDIVITIAGLGPTVDDITCGTLTNLIGKSRFNAARHIENWVGTAPGLIVEYEGKLIVCLPGPPRELKPMFEKRIAPILKKRRPAQERWIIRSRTVKLTGLAESKVDAAIKDLLKLKPPTTVGIYAKLGQVDLRVMAKAKSANSCARGILGIEKIIEKRLKPYIFGYDNDRLEDAAARALIGKGKTIAIAESCTGGLLSHRLTNVSGSSKYLLASVVTYSDTSKVYVLGVSDTAIARFGAVSRRVALDMARGVRALCSSDIGIAITGIAGPGGGTSKKPVGLVYIALVSDGKRTIKEFRFSGSREEIKYQASQAALDMIRKNC